jgi:hypothetical protein
MPKQNRPFGKKGEQVAVKPAIKIAKPEMTLTGFEHSKKVLKEKERLAKKQIDMAETKSSSRRSRSHLSSKSGDLRNPNSVEDDSEQLDFSIDKADVPPMN